MSSKMTFRPLTGLCLAAAAVFAVLAFVYFTKSAGALPSILPGHQAGSPHIHEKHAMAMIGLACVALVAAWFTTAPGRSGAS